MYRPLNGYTKKSIIQSLQDGIDGRPSMIPTTGDNEDTVCAYRGEGGNKCAVGCFIPDNVYTTDLEGKAFEVLVKSGFESLNDFMPLNIEAMGELQFIHDNCTETQDPRPILIEWIHENVEDN